LGWGRALRGGGETAGHEMGKVKVAALAVVNAFGDVRDPRTGKLVAGARHSPASSELADTELLMRGGREGGLTGGNTTLVVVATNAKLSKVGATRLAKMAQGGVLRALSPGHTMSDGDIVIALSLGEESVNLSALGVAAADVVGQAIVRGVTTAKGLGGVPGLG
jgi:L-aminopeptidase/D-esterase-like protein